MTEDLHSLLGVYVLDALDPLERRRFEDHLERCDTCAVAGMVAAAAALASVVAEAPPAALRDTLLSRVAETRQDPPVARRRPIRRVTRLGRVLLPVAAAIALVVGVLAVVNRRDGSTRGGDLAAVVAAPDAKVVDLRNQATDVVMRVVWSPSAGKGAVVATGLADPGTDRAYEMWAIGAEGPRPVGVLRPNAHGELNATMDLNLAGAAMVGVTIEPAQGSPKPTGTVLASGTI